jgi:hypothetical protein
LLSPDFFLGRINGETETRDTRERERERERESVCVCELWLREKNLETADGVPERRTYIPCCIRLVLL